MNSAAKKILAHQCNNCVHTIKGECPLLDLWFGPKDHALVSPRLAAIVHNDLLKSILPMSGLCKMFWPRVRQVK